MEWKKRQDMIIFRLVKVSTVCTLLSYFQPYSQITNSVQDISPKHSMDDEKIALVCTVGRSNCVFKEFV